jgi:hypothetical protein
MLMHGWIALHRLKPGSILNDKELTQFRVLLTASDHIVRSLER